MDQNNVNIFTLIAYHLIMSDITNKPYIDADNKCYLFEAEAEAKEFCGRVEHTHYNKAQNYNVLNASTEFYDDGIEIMCLKRKGKEVIEVPVEYGDCKNCYMNPFTNRNILRLKQTAQKRYLRNLKEAAFLAPLNIEVRFPKQYPRLNYSYASFNGTDIYYTLFTSLAEFNTWNASQNNIWKPMELNLLKFGRIRQTKPVIINPLSDKLILTDSQIQIALKS